MFHLLCIINRTRRYCQRSCQVSDFVTHKHLCKLFRKPSLAQDPRILVNSLYSRQKRQKYGGHTDEDDNYEEEQEFGLYEEDIKMDRRFTTLQTCSKDDRIIFFAHAEFEIYKLAGMSTRTAKTTKSQSQADDEHKHERTHGSKQDNNNHHENQLPMCPSLPLCRDSQDAAHRARYQHPETKARSVKNKEMYQNIIKGHPNNPI